MCQDSRKRKNIKIIRVLLLILIITYSILMPILYGLKIFSLTASRYIGNHYTGNDNDISVFHYSVIDTIQSDDSWLIFASLLTNIMLIVSAILAFALKNNRSKNVFRIITGVLFITSLIFVILTFVLGTRNPASSVVPK